MSKHYQDCEIALQNYRAELTERWMEADSGDYDQALLSGALTVLGLALEAIQQAHKMESSLE